jgi:hypothetical protein
VFRPVATLAAGIAVKDRAALAARFEGTIMILFFAKRADLA